MKKFCGSFPPLHLKMDTRLSFRMPEVPLTKSCPDDHSQYGEEIKSQDESLRTINEQKEAVKGLSLWYTNHLSVMYAIQKHKDFRNAKVKSFTKDLDEQSTFDNDNAFKLKQQPLGPHIDLENYLNSLKSRQKEMRSFGKRSKVWDKYFEKAIPGWNELKQSTKIYPSLMNKITKKRSCFQKLNLVAKVKRKSSLSTRNSSKILFNPQSQTSERSIFSSAQKPIQRLSKLRYSHEDLDMSVNLENKVRDYFLNSAAVKNEQMGNINNEILFNQVYGKYFTRDEKNETEKRKKIRPKANKKAISSDILFLKQHHEENRDNEDSRESLKHIDGLIKSKQKELESLLMGMDNSSQKENIIRSRNDSSSRRRSKRLNVKPNSNKRSSSVQPYQRRGTPVFIDIPRIPRKKKSQKNVHRKLLKSPSRMYMLKSDARRRLDEKRRASYRTSVIEAANSRKNSPPPTFGHVNNENREVLLVEPFKEKEVGEENENFPKKKRAPKNKNELRHQLMDVVNSVWTSDKKLGGLESLHTYRNPSVPTSKSISEHFE